MVKCAGRPQQVATTPAGSASVDVTSAACIGWWPSACGQSETPWIARKLRRGPELTIVAKSTGPDVSAADACG